MARKDLVKITIEGTPPYLKLKVETGKARLEGMEMVTNLEVDAAKIEVVDNRLAPIPSIVMRSALDRAVD